MREDNLREYFDKFLPSDVNVESLPLKHISFAALPASAHPQARGITPRAVAALASAAASANCKLDEGAVFPRHLANPRCVIENGVARDIVKSGLATITSHKGQEAFRLTAAGAAAIRAQVSAAVREKYAW